jgi:branched-chain amino acid transport system permease protein
MLVGGIVAALFGFVVGLPALRLKGDYLAIVTLAFGEIVRNLCMNMPFFGGALGLKNEHTYGKDLYVVAFVTVIVLLIVIQNLVRSKHGRAIIAIKDNEIAARATGIDVTKYKLFVFTISSFFAGIAGVLYSYTQARVQTSTFDYNYSIEILVMVVLGGMGSINGSMVAAALITFINVKLQTILTGNLAVLQKVIYALILIGIVIYRNAPGLKGFREKYNFNTLVVERFKKKQTVAENTDAKEEEASND